MNDDGYDDELDSEVETDLDDAEFYQGDRLGRVTIFAIFAGWILIAWTIWKWLIRED